MLCSSFISGPSLFLAWLLLFISFPASADYKYVFNSHDYCGCSALCDAFATNSNVKICLADQHEVGGNMRCDCHYTSIQNPCPSSSTYNVFSSGTCQGCVPDDTPQVKTFRGASGSSACISGCLWTEAALQCGGQYNESTGCSIEVGTNCDSSNVCDWSTKMTKSGSSCSTNSSSPSGAVGTSDCSGSNKPDCEGNKFCGTVNGVSTCVDGVRDGECATTPNGAVVCVASPHSAPSGSRPTGTPTVKFGDVNGADGIVSPGAGGGGGAGVVDVYPPGSGSGNAGGGKWDGESGGSGGDCTGPDCGSGDGSGDGTFGTGKYGRSMDAVPSFSESTNLVKTAISALSPGEVTSELADGVCPFTTSFHIGGQSYSFSSVCDSWQSISGYISGVAYFMWGVIAFFVIWSA